MKFHQKNLTFKQKNKPMSNNRNHLLHVGVEFDVALIKVDENRTWERVKLQLEVLKIEWQNSCCYVFIPERNVI